MQIVRFVEKYQPGMAYVLIKGCLRSLRDCFLKAVSLDGLERFANRLRDKVHFALDTHVT